MYEKVNPSHPDKLADRIAGAMLDYAYKEQKDPRVAIEVLLGHGVCTIIAETSVHFYETDIMELVERIVGTRLLLRYTEVPQDEHLARNQAQGMRCGDNGIFRGVPTTQEQSQLAFVAHEIYDRYKTDGKYILDGDKLIICQSNSDEWLHKEYPTAIVNPLGEWTGGQGVDAGATNRKLGSDMGDAVTGGGLHGKDLSKADVSVNIYAHLIAQETGKPIELSCAIGDESVGGIPYNTIVDIARAYIADRGGFEKFAEWGLISW